MLGHITPNESDSTASQSDLRCEQASWHVCMSLEHWMKAWGCHAHPGSDSNYSSMHAHNPRMMCSFAQVDGPLQRTFGFDV